MARTTTAQVKADLDTHKAQCTERHNFISKEFASVRRDISGLRGEMRWAIGGLGALILSLIAIVVGTG